MLHPAPNSQNLELNHELLNLDHANRGHRPDGKFMSNQEMEMIAAHQDEIHESLSDYQVAKQSAEQPDEIKTNWTTTPEYATDLFQQVLKKTSDLEQRLESGRSNKTETESTTSAEQTPETSDHNSIEARLQRVREGHKQLDKLEQQLNANPTDTPVIEVKKDDFTEEHKHELNRHLGEDNQLFGIDPADVVEVDGPKQSVSDTVELPAVEDEADLKQEKTRGMRVSLKQVSKRLTHIMQKAYTEVNTRITDYLNDEKGGWDRAERRKNTVVYGGILGAAAIALSMKYGVDLDMGGGGSVDALTPDSPNTGLMDAHLELPAVNSEVHQMVAGDNPWSISKELVNSQGINDIAATDAVKDWIMQHNSISDSTHMVVGTEIRMPSPAQIEEILKPYKS